MRFFNSISDEVTAFWCHFRPLFCCSGTGKEHPWGNLLIKKSYPIRVFLVTPGNVTTEVLVFLSVSYLGGSILEPTARHKSAKAEERRRLLSTLYVHLNLSMA